MFLSFWHDSSESPTEIAAIVPMISNKSIFSPEKEQQKQTLNARWFFEPQAERVVPHGFLRASWLSSDLLG